MKIKSVSAENLGNIVKQMINTALEDSDQMAKLHQAIYEEWYFKKMMELGNARSKTKNAKNVLEKIIQEVSCSSSNLIKNILSRDNSTNTWNEIKYFPKQNLDNINLINHDKFDRRDMSIMCNKSVECTQTNIYIEHKKTYEISKDQECVVSNNIAPNLEIIEVRNNPKQRTKIRKKLESNITEQQSREQIERKLVKQVRRKLSFESWKRKKNQMYRKLLKEAEEKKQHELQKKFKDIKYKKASQEAYAQIIKEKEDQQKMELFAKRLQMTQQMNMETLQKQIDERRIINNQVFNAWKRQKDIKLREAKLITMGNAPYQLKRLVDPMTLTDRPNSQFDSWLDQLDNVLHKKYLRERRYLVRSFYCQPTYYGAAAMCYI